MSTTASILKRFFKFQGQKTKISHFRDQSLILRMKLGNSLENQSCGDHTTLEWPGTTLKCIRIGLDRNFTPYLSGNAEKMRFIVIEVLETFLFFIFTFFCQLVKVIYVQ